MKKICSVVFLAFLMCIFSSSKNVYAEDLYLCSGTVENMFNLLEKYASSHKIKLWGKKFVRGNLFSYSSGDIIRAHYGSNDKNNISIESSSDKKHISMIDISSQPIADDEMAVLTSGILSALGADDEAIYKFSMEYTAYYSKLATKEKIKVSKLSKRFEVKCKPNNKIIYVYVFPGTENVDYLALCFSANKTKYRY